MIYNPPEIAQQKENESKDSNKSRREKDMEKKGALQVAIKMEKVIPVFIQQLKMLLGVSSNEWVCGFSVNYNQIPYFLEISVLHTILCTCSLKELTK